LPNQLELRIALDIGLAESVMKRREFITFGNGASARRGFFSYSVSAIGAIANVPGLPR
jgi:hypothetical protein